ncbi:hypothetical protein CXQ85_000530 [Candidozyma haemuli]|uniref:Uncharacterized protein n=1 Tax=Candidozyma haemuli TaxID=45357 RepID=A0A2V1AUR6_9ASCO|nr:hypothetical protein CXQ85_000530 [[Candida] haemuloni]PVH21549.1 hypothetical protein CXQ85_000530 [[Candida] haemuloni]
MLFFRKSSRYQASSPTFFDKLQMAHLARELGPTFSPVEEHLSFYRRVKNALKLTSAKLKRSREFRDFKVNTPTVNLIKTCEESEVLPQRFPRKSFSLRRFAILGRNKSPGSSSEGSMFSSTNTSFIQPSNNVASKCNKITWESATQEKQRLAKSFGETPKKAPVVFGRHAAVPTDSPYHSHKKWLLFYEVLKSHALGKPSKRDISPYGLIKPIYFSKGSTELPAVLPNAPEPLSNKKAPVTSTALVPWAGNKHSKDVTTSEEEEVTGLAVDLSELMKLANQRFRPMKGIRAVEIKVRSSEYNKHTSALITERSSLVSFPSGNFIEEVVTFRTTDCPRTVGLFTSKQTSPARGILSLTCKEDPPIQESSLSPRLQLAPTYPEIVKKVDELVKETKFAAVKTETYQAKVAESLVKFKEAFNLINATFNEPVITDYLDYIHKFICVGDDISSTVGECTGMAQELDCMREEFVSGQISEKDRKRLFNFGQNFKRLDEAESNVRQQLDLLARDHECRLDVLHDDIQKIKGLSGKVTNAYDKFIARHCRSLDDEGREELSRVLGRVQYNHTSLFFTEWNKKIKNEAFKRHLQQLEDAYDHKEELLLLLKQGFINVCKHI